MLALGVVAASTAVSTAHAERRGSVSFGAFGGYGGIFASTGAATDTTLDTSQYDYGISYGVRMRYKLRGPAALGTSFEAQGYSRIGAAAENTPKSS